MASKKTRKPDDSLEGTTSNELLDELASFLYDAYLEDKEKRSDKIVLEKGRIAENEDDTKHWYSFNASSWRLFGFPQACPRDAS